MKLRPALIQRQRVSSMPASSAASLALSMQPALSRESARRSL